MRCFCAWELNNCCMYFEIQIYNSFSGVWAAGVVVYVVCMLLTVISREGFGLGDAKLLGMTAVFTGGAYVLQIAFWGLICAFICSIFILAYHKGNRKTELPFVPFLTLGIFLHIVVWRLL